jgi:hypothetical protein
MNVFQGTPNKLKHLWPRLAEQLLHQGRSIGQQGATGSQRREAIADPLLDDGAAHRNIRCGEPVARLVAGGILPKVEDAHVCCAGSDVHHAMESTPGFQRRQVACDLSHRFRDHKDAPIGPFVRICGLEPCRDPIQNACRGLVGGGRLTQELLGHMANLVVRSQKRAMLYMFNRHADIEADVELGATVEHSQLLAHRPHLLSKRHRGHVLGGTP